MSSHYPPYIKTVLKTGAIVHLLVFFMGLSFGTVRYFYISRNGRPQRRYQWAGLFDSQLQVRDQRHRELIRPLLEGQFHNQTTHIIDPLIHKRLD